MPIRSRSPSCAGASASCACCRWRCCCARSGRNAQDWPAVAGLGVAFFGLFFVLYNIALGYTTAARASLALSTLPLQTMLVGALLGIEPLTARKSLGVAIAMLGVFAALASGLAAAPPGAWRGELIMTGAVLCMAFYNVWSRPFIQRSSALGFLTVGMGAGAAALVLVGIADRQHAVLRSLRRRRNGSPASISASPAARWRSSCGCWRCRGRRRRGSPTP